MAVHLVTDSTSDLTPELLEGLDVTVIPLSVYFGEEELRDGVDIDALRFYERLVQSAELPRTSQPSVEAFRDVYEQLTQGDDEVVSVHLSAKLSGTLNSAHNARLALEDRSDRIHLVDSQNVSVGLGAIVRAAAQAAREGASGAAVAELATAMRQRVRVVALVGTLEYLQRGGRIGRAQSMLGSLLKIKPLVQVEDGEVAPFDRVRTHRRAVERLLDVVREHPNAVEVYVGCGTNIDEAAGVAASVRDILPGIPVHPFHLGPVIGVYTGPQVLGIAIVDAP